MNKATLQVLIFQMPAFKKTYKKLHANAKIFVDQAIQTVIANPNLGQIKKGDLDGVYVYKFKIQQQEYLLAYEWDIAQRTLIALGVHENFYRALIK